MKKILGLALFFALFTACTRSADSVTVVQTAGPFPTGIFIPLSSYGGASSNSMPATLIPGSLQGTPTPDNPLFSFSQPEGSNEYVVQAGNTLGDIADLYGISVEQIMEANNMTDPDVLDVGQVLVIPLSGQVVTSNAAYFKIIPDSELVYGPMSITIDINSYVQSRGGYLASFMQDVDGETLTGAQIIQRVAQDYSLNPRLLLAILEYLSSWVGDPAPAVSALEYPIGY